MPAHDSHKFLTLDALRGVAALIVVEYHIWGYEVVSHGYLAVDFFFLLSGFVLALAYQERLDAGWSTWSFLKVRLIRLYPLYILGTLLGLATLMAVAAYGTPADAWRWYVLLTGFAIFMLPRFIPVPLTQGGSYPLDFPVWSLIVEILANVVHATLLRRRSDRFLAFLVLIFGGMLLLVAERAQSVNFGVYTSDLPEASVRVLFSYTLGMLLFRVWKRGRFHFQLHFLLSPCLLGLALMWPWMKVHGLLYDLLVIFLFFPLLLMVSASSHPPAPLVNLARNLGRISYAIYVLHAPLRELQLIVELHLVVLNRWVHLSRTRSNLITTVLAITVALLADRFYDAPVRAYLQRKFSKNKPIPSLSSIPVSR